MPPASPPKQTRWRRIRDWTVLGVIAGFFSATSSYGGIGGWVWLASKFAFGVVGLGVLAAWVAVVDRSRRREPR